MWVSSVKATIESRTKEARPVLSNVIFLWSFICCLSGGCYLLNFCFFLFGFSWTCLKFRKATTKMSTATLSWVWIYWVINESLTASWMLFKQIFTAYFSVSLACSTFSFSSQFHFRISHHDRHNVIEHSRKIIQHIFFFVYLVIVKRETKQAEKWIELPILLRRPIVKRGLFLDFPVERKREKEHQALSFMTKWIRNVMCLSVLL